MRLSALAATLLSTSALGSAVLADAPRVATDIAPVHSIVAAVMDGVGTPDLIVRPGASPHGYSLRPSEARALEAADLVVWIGPDLTPWLEGPLEALAGDAATLALMDAEGTVLLDAREGAAFAAGHEGHDHGDDTHAAHDDHGHDEHGHDEHGHDDHAEHAHDDHGHDAHKEHAHDAHGHDDHDHDHAAHDHADEAHAEEAHEDHAGHAHGDHDPHAWLDPRNAALWAQAVGAQLAALDPDHAEAYTANAAAFAEEMGALEAEVSRALAPVAGQPFVVFHDAYQYFEERFGTTAAGAISASDAASASAARVAEVAERVAELGAVCALTEPQFNPGLLNAIGAAKLGEIDPIGATLAPGPALYGDMIRAMAAALKGCLSGT